MKNFVLILSKTQMKRNQVCIGGLTSTGRYVRLIDSNGNNQPEDTEFKPKQVWEIEFVERDNNTPPHVEDVIVLSTRKIGILKKEITIKDFIQKRKIPIWVGSPDNLFDHLVQWTTGGSGYIDSNEEQKCWLQLSGWYDLGLHSDIHDDLPF